MAATKPYKAKSLKNAEIMVRQLRRQVQECDRYLGHWMNRCKVLSNELRLVSRLAVKEPAFFSLLESCEAVKIRDRVLAESGMNPDGTLIPKTTPPTTP